MMPWLSLAAAVACAMVAMEAMAAVSEEGRGGKVCGPNALFMFLILSGHPEVELKQLQGIPVTGEGSSLLALSQAARRVGLETEIRRYRPEAIEALPLPAIVQFRNAAGPGATHHYLVIYKVGREYYYLIDGSTGLVRSGHRSRLANFWTGYALVAKPPAGVWGALKSHPALSAGALVLLESAGLALGWLYWVQRRSGAGPEAAV
jgi:ABC-type bacteriocin/lantibiotic exporter with double-glycine peptidase domain